MSGFRKTFNFEVDFDGDKVLFVLRRLSQKHLMTISDSLPETISPGQSLNLDQSVKLVTDCKGVLSDCVISMQGLKDADGVSIEFEDTLEEAYFLNLHGSVVQELFSRTLLTEEVQKKLDEQSATSQNLNGQESVEPIQQSTA